MYEADFLKATITQVASHLRGNGWEVCVEDVSDPLAKPVWETKRLYPRSEAVELVEDINDTIARAECVCGISARFITEFGDLESDVSDVLAYCSPECKDLADEEYEAMERAGL